MEGTTKADQLRVVLVAPRNPLNIGAAARAMSNFGFSRLRVVNPYEVAYRDAKSAVGASPVLTDSQEFANVAEAIADCTLVVGTTAVKHRQLQQPLKVLADGAFAIKKRLTKSPVALLFGSEKWGLSNDALSHCHWVMHIPTRKEHQSMNLGQAVVTLATPYVVAGCALSSVPSPPCVSAQWVAGATRVLAGGMPVITQTSQAVCVPTGQGLIVITTQPRVIAT